MKLNTYLHFNGQAETVLQFYAKVLRGDIKMLMRYKDMPADETHKMEVDPKQIMHGRLEFGDNVIMVSDAPSGCEMHLGNSISLSINLGANEQAEAERLYNALKENGEVKMPLGPTFWSSAFAMLKDQFGIDWMINCEKPMDKAP